MKNKQEQMVRGRLDNGLPSQEILDHYQSEARKLSETLSKEEGEHYLREALREYPPLLEVELERFIKA